MRSLTLFAATLLAALAAAAPARALLVYQRGLTAETIWAADDDGGGAHRLVAGILPHVSRDGATVIYATAGAHAELRAIPAIGGTPRTLLMHWQYGAFAWSPDGRWVVAQAGPLTGAQRLVLIDLTTGARRTLARGSFAGASFAPDGSAIVYARAAATSVFAASNLYVAPLSGGAPRALTHDGRSLYPIWGPARIAFTHWTRPTGRRGDAPKYDLRLIAPDGGAAKALTHDHAGFLLSGLVPVAWSADGTRLLAQFNGQDTAYAVAVNPVTGRERRLTGVAEGPVAAALSSDGSTVLAGRGGGAFGGHSEVIAIPYAGGAAKLLTRGQVPDWNR